MNIKAFKQDLLNRLYEPYKQCTQCPLGTLGRTHVVLGEGNPDARIIFVGEGPGKQEDEQNRPFVGRSGKLLTKILTNSEIKREDVYITNIVKCRPPNNRNPHAIEIATCTNLLLFNQIKIINPTVIVTLGAVAFRVFHKGTAAISSFRGKVITLNQISLIPTYHPAYILRNPKELPTLEHDIKLAIETAKTSSAQ